MTTHITLIGSIPVGPGAAEDFNDLLAVLEPDAFDSVDLSSDGELVISIDDAEVPHGYCEPALAALAAFCHKHATAGAVFDYGDGDTLVFGPTPEAKQTAHIEYLKEAVIEAEALLEQAICHDLSFYDKDIV